jgi:RNA polymerase sigma-70 factor (ECF subfamily)
MATVTDNPQVISFEAFYRTEYGPMVALATAVGGNPGVGEDIAQEALIRAHKNWAQICSYERPGTWLRRTTINLALNVRRGSRRQRAAIQRLGSRPANPVEIILGDPAVWQAVAALPARQRAAVALHYLEDRSIDEIAGILECSPNTAKAHLHHGRQSLASHLKENEQ